MQPAPDVETWTIRYASELELDDWEPADDLIRFRKWGPMVVDGITSYKSIDHVNTTVTQPMFMFKTDSNDMDNVKKIPFDSTYEYDQWHWVFCGMFVPEGTVNCGRSQCLVSQRKKELGIG